MDTFHAFRELDRKIQIDYLADPHNIQTSAAHVFPEAENPSDTYLGLAMNFPDNGEKGSHVLERVGRANTVFVAQFLHSLAAALEERLQQGLSISAWHLPLLRLRHRGANPQSLEVLEANSLLATTHRAWTPALAVTAEARALTWEDVAFLGYLLGLNILHSVLSRGYEMQRGLTNGATFLHISPIDNPYQQYLTVECCRQYAGALLYAWEVVGEYGEASPEVCLNAALDCAVAMVHQPVKELELPRLFYTYLAKRPQAIAAIMKLGREEGADKIVGVARTRMAPLLLGMAACDMDVWSALIPAVLAFNNELDPTVAYAIIEILSSNVAKLADTNQILQLNVPPAILIKFIFYIQNFGSNVVAMLTPEQIASAPVVFLDMFRRRLTDTFHALAFGPLPLLTTYHPLIPLCLSLLGPVLDNMEDLSLARHLWDLLVALFQAFHGGTTPLALALHTNTVGLTAQRLRETGAPEELTAKVVYLEGVSAEQERLGRVCALMSTGLISPIALPTHLPTDLTAKLTTAERCAFNWYIMENPPQDITTPALEEAKRIWDTQEIHFFNSDVLFRHVYKDATHPLTTNPLHAEYILDVLMHLPRLRRAVADVAPCVS